MPESLLTPPQSATAPPPTTAAQPTQGGDAPPVGPPPGPDPNQTASLMPPPGEAPPEERPRDPMDPGTYFDGGEASPEEQKQFDTLFTVLMKAVHGKKTRDKFLKPIREAKPSQLGHVIGMQAFQLFTFAEDLLAKRGIDLQDAVKLEAGQELVAELVQLAVLVKKVPDEEEAIGTTIAGAIDVFASRYGKGQQDRGGRDQRADLMHMSELIKVADQRFPLSEMAKGMNAMQEKASRSVLEADAMEAAGIEMARRRLMKEGEQA